jgi:hypothetical protein
MSKTAGVKHPWIAAISGDEMRLSAWIYYSLPPASLEAQRSQRIFFLICRETAANQKHQRLGKGTNCSNFPEGSALFLIGISRSGKEKSFSVPSVTLW